MRNSLPSERAAIVATIDPDAYDPGTQTSDWVDMSLFGSIMAIIQSGTLGAGTTLAAKLEQATSSAGAGAKDITGKAITTVDEDESPQYPDSQWIINCKAEELDAANGFRYVRLSMTLDSVASPDAACDAGGIVLGFDPRYAPAEDNDLGSVAEIVA